MVAVGSIRPLRTSRMISRGCAENATPRAKRWAEPLFAQEIKQRTKSQWLSATQDLRPDHERLALQKKWSWQGPSNRRSGLILHRARGRPQDNLTRQFLLRHSLRRAVKSNAYSAGRSPHDVALASHAGVTTDQQRKLVRDLSAGRHFDLGTQLGDIDNRARSRRHPTSELQLGRIGEDPTSAFAPPAADVILKRRTNHGPAQSLDALRLTMTSTPCADRRRFLARPRLCQWLRNTRPTASTDGAICIDYCAKL